MKVIKLEMVSFEQSTKVLTNPFNLFIIIIIGIIINVIIITDMIMIVILGSRGHSCQNQSKWLPAAMSYQTLGRLTSRL